MKNIETSSNYFYLNESLHARDILGQEDNSSIIWLLSKSISFEDLVVTSIVISCKSIAFCKIYFANRRLFADPSKFKIVHDLRWDETHSRTEFGHFHSLDDLDHHCQMNEKQHLSKYIWNRTSKQIYYSTNLTNKKNLKLGTMLEQLYYAIPAMKEAIIL